MTNYLDVKVPETGPLNREQAWALVCRIKATLHDIYLRYNPAPKEDALSFYAVSARVNQLATSLGENVLDRLASLTKPGAKTTEHSPLVQEIMSVIRWDVRLLEARGGNITEIALLLLGEYGHGLDAERIGMLIENSMNPNTKWSDVWTCPNCDGRGLIEKEQCKRCHSWGYVFGAKPTNEEYDKSLKGRLALNHDQPWTDEQEAEEQTRLEHEDE